MALATRSLSAFASRVHGEVERGVPHGGLSGAGGDAVLEEVRPKGVALCARDGHSAAIAAQRSDLYAEQSFRLSGCLILAPPRELMQEL